MAEITLDQLGEKAQLFLTDLMAVSDSNGILYGNTLQDFANFFSTASGVDFKDSISAGTYATKDAGWYFATDTGDYIMGATTIAVDVSNTLTIIIVDATIDNSSKVEVPISITIDATPTAGSTNAVQSGGVADEIASKNPIIEANSVKLPTFTNGREFYAGSFIKKINLTFSSDFSPYKDDLTIKRLRVNTINYLSATQVYISWAIEKNDGTTHVISGSDYYVDIGGDVSDISGNYSRVISDEGTIHFDFTFDFSSITEGVSLSSNADFTNGKISDSILLNSFVNDYNKQSKLNADGTINKEYVAGGTYLTDVSGLNYELYRNNETVLDSGKNLYNEIEENKTSGYLDASGNIISHSTAFITNYIQIFKGIEYAFQGYYSQTTRYVTYDKDFNIVRVLGGDLDAIDSGTFTPLENELYVRFSVRNENEFMLEIGGTQSDYEPFLRFVKSSLLPTESSLFKDLKVVVFGDSITVLTNNWTNSFKTITGITDFTNMAISGQKICWRAGTTETVTPPTDADDNNVLWNSILKYQDLYPTGVPDVIIIALGTNDISQASPLGSFTDAFSQDESSTSQLTMAGAYRKAISKLMTDYPDVQIFYSTPIQSITGGRSYATLKEVADINSEISNRMNVRVIDCLHLSGIYEAFENNGVAGRYLYDGTHPSEEGALMQGKCIAKEFEKMYYFES